MLIRHGDVINAIFKSVYIAVYYIFTFLISYDNGNILNSKIVTFKNRYIF